MKSEDSLENFGQFMVVNGRVRGWIATRTIDLRQLGLRPVESQNERAPLYEILALNVGNEWQFGALWERSHATRPG